MVIWVVNLLIQSQVNVMKTKINKLKKNSINKWNGLNLSNFHKDGYIHFRECFFSIRILAP